MFRISAASANIAQETQSLATSIHEPAPWSFACRNQISMACLAWTSFGRFLAEREEGLQGALSRRALCRVVLQRLPLGTSFVLRTFRAAAICRRFAVVTSFPCAWLSASCSFRAVAPCPWPHQLGCRGTLRSVRTTVASRGGISTALIAASGPS